MSPIESMRRRGGGRAIGLLCCAALFGTATRAETPPITKDDEFIASLGEGGAGDPIDLRRLAKLLFGQASTLEGGATGVRLLQGQVASPPASTAAQAEGPRRSVEAYLEERHADYARALSDFRRSVSDLLDRPDSRLALYDAVVAAQRACWRLDVYLGFVGTYANGPDMTPALPSREACARLRTALFQPRVTAIVRESLLEQQSERAELRELREEQRDLEALLEDLRKIDEAD
jgi:hypothetical protein